MSRQGTGRRVGGLGGAPSAGGTRAGNTLFELLGSVAVLAVALNALVGGILGSMRHQAATRETSAAVDAAESVIELIAAVKFDEVYARFNDTDLDDPLPADEIGSPGSGFDVPGLTLLAGDADGMVGRIVMPGDGTSLLEDVAAADLGMPRDLDGDDVVDGLDHAATYLVLPVRVAVEWQGAGGPRRVSLVTTLAGRR